MKSVFENQLQSAIKAYEDASVNRKYNDGSDMGEQLCQQLYTSCLAAIERVVGKDSVQFQETQQRRYAGNEFVDLAKAVGVCRSLLADLRNGYLRSLSEVIHAEVHADYLEMAEHLNSNGYKDAAAVIAGSSLEAHIKSLCIKHSLPTDIAGKPIKADTLNGDLVKAGAYTKLDQKSITSWLGLRNDAAHGNYSAYNQNQVSLLISSVRDFIGRNPA